MPDRLIDNPQIREFAAIVLSMIAGMIAKTLVSNEPFKLRSFVGEVILAAMFGASIYALGVIQGLDFWQTLLMSLLSGMGATRSLEWLIKVVKVVSK